MSHVSAELGLDRSGMDVMVAVGGEPIRPKERLGGGHIKGSPEVAALDANRLGRQLTGILALMRLLEEPSDVFRPPILVHSHRSRRKEAPPASRKLGLNNGATMTARLTVSAEKRWR